jgi:hypothetical protein
MNNKLVNFIVFQIGWFTCVLSAANGYPWAGLMVVSLIVALHLRSAEHRAHEIQLLALAVVLGLVFDSLLVSSGWVRYPIGMFMPGIAPYWILAMWALFSITLNLSMGWLKNSLVLASVMGAIFGPLSYLAGARLGAIVLVDAVSSMILLAIIWALVMPILIFAASRFDGERNAAQLVPLQKLNGSD